MCSYSGQEDGRVGLYVAAEPLTPAKNYFEVEIVESGVMGAIGMCPSQVVIANNNSNEHFIYYKLLLLLLFNDFFSKQIGIFDDHDGCEWVNVSSGTDSSGLSRTKSTKPLNGCVCVLCVCFPGESGLAGTRMVNYSGF